MSNKIYPTETGCIENTNNINLWGIRGIKSIWKHFQGIAQLGNEYTILSSSANDKALILAHKDKIVAFKGLPPIYEHAGGIDALKLWDGWMIVVPVYYKTPQKRKYLRRPMPGRRIRSPTGTKDSQYKSTTLHYFFSEKNRNQALECRRITELDGGRAYAAGIARNGNSVVVAVMIDGNRVQFLKCDDPNREYKYTLGPVWDAEMAGEQKKEWNGYPNSISLINHGEKIYFLGMHLDLIVRKIPLLGKIPLIKDIPKGKDRIDVYSVNLNADNVELSNKQNFHAICNPSSFRWGGNAQILSPGKVEILAVERNVQVNKVQGNVYVRYNKFYLDIDNSGTLKQPEIPTDRLTI